MDKCEVHECVLALGELLTELGEKRTGSAYKSIAEKNAEGIISWWVPEKGYYLWHKTDDGRGSGDINWKVFYPDAMEQVWPFLWGIEDSNSTRLKTVWQKFNKENPEWVKKDVDWPMLSTIAMRLGEYETAIAHTRNILKKRLNDKNWQVNEQYWTILNCCMDLDIDAPLRVADKSWKREGNEISCTLTSNVDVKSQIRVRNSNADIFIDGKNVQNTLSGQVISVPVEIKKNQKIRLKIRSLKS
jgi:hypothetical protein